MTRVSSELLTKAAFGVKDMTDNIFDVWQSIFVKKQSSSVLQSLIRDRIREEKEKAGISTTKYVLARTTTQKVRDQKPSSESPTEQVYNIVSRHGEFDKVIDGVFAFYPTMGYNDPMLNKVFVHQHLLTCRLNP